MNYLIYVERAAENLQFFLWIRDYARRFEALPASEKSLSPPWIPQRGAAEHAPSTPRFPAAAKSAMDATVIFKGSDFDTAHFAFVENAPNPFDDDVSASKWDADASTVYSSVRPVDNLRTTTAATFEAANIPVLPCEWCSAVPPSRLIRI